jgi:hypothetical protein
MRSRFGRIVAVGAVLASFLAVSAPAGAQVTAEDPPPEVLYVPAFVVGNPFQPGSATIYGVYRCFGGDPIHLWVSVKQGGPDPTAEGSGATSTSWYDTNVLEAPPVTCDGRYHLAAVPVGQHPDKAPLSSGQAWVQFCLVAPGGGEFGIVASQSEWATVVGVLR